MNEVMIKNWNGKIAPTDIVYHLGDFAMGRAEEVPQIINRLNGNIYLIRGNHDGNMADIYENHFEKVSYDRTIQLTVNNKTRNIYMVHDPQDRKFDRFTLCGHTHDYWRFLPNRLNLSVEQWNYRPVSVEDVKHYIGTNDYHKERAEEEGHIHDRDAKAKQCLEHES
jgi:calcineurin-like phosphoesterase family protein